MDSAQGVDKFSSLKIRKNLLKYACNDEICNLFVESIKFHSNDLQRFYYLIKIVFIFALVNLLFNFLQQVL